MSDLMTACTMAGTPTIDQAKIAIAHALETIKTNPYVGYQCGIGSATFALLTEAHSTLHGIPVDIVREYCMPTETINPRAHIEASDDTEQQSASETLKEIFADKDEEIRLLREGVIKLIERLQPNAGGVMHIYDSDLLIDILTGAIAQSIKR